MPNVPEINQWEESITLISEEDWVEGGIDGIDNLPHKQLANRTTYLKNQLAALQQEVNEIPDNSGKFDPATGHKHTGIGSDGPKLDANSLTSGAATDTVIGNRAIDDTTVATTGTDTVTKLLGKIGYMIKAITGKSNWFTAPTKTLEQLNTEKLSRSGDTMTGPLTLAADPTANMQAVTKIYADNNGGVNLRKSSHAYVVGDICYSKSAASYKYMQCTVDGTTAATEPTWPDVGQTVTDGGVTWVVRDIRAGEQVGSIKAWLANAAPPGWLALDTGALVSRATYPQLWAWVQAYAPLITEAAWQTQAAAQTSVGAYSSGDGSTTFRLPRIVDFVRGASSTRTPGTWQADMFQGHAHDYNTKLVSNDTGTGAPTSGTPAATDVTWLTDSYNGVLLNGHFYREDNFGNGTPRVGLETRPKSITMLFCVKAFDAPVNQGLIDITALAAEVAEKQKTIPYIQIQDEKPSGTSGGTFANGAWRTRTLNTIKNNDNNIATLSNNQITLPAGTYEFEASCPAQGVDSHIARLQNITDGVTVALGTSENSTGTSNSDQVQSRSIVAGKFTIEAQKTFEVQHYGVVSYSNSIGFGAPASSGINETYTVVRIWKVG